MTRHLVVLALLVAACGDDGAAYSVEKLMDPATCMECHPKHHEQWAASMHAYASDDPVFVAMNKRGQRDTNGELGTFCLKCHAPMAVASGTITAANAADFDPASLAPTERGITCYFCHNVDKIVADHNNGLVLANDQTMRGGLKNPVGNKAHHATYDPLMDSDANESEMCGSCHDVTTPKGVELERSFKEWKTTFFATNKDPTHHLTCASCHMKSKTDVVADGPGLDVPQRAGGYHEHLWPAIDEALIPWPGMDLMATGIKRDLDPSIAVTGPAPRVTGDPTPGGICVLPNGSITVRVDSIGTGHNWPSGAAHDRRAWLEVIAYRADNSIFFQSGVVPDGMDPEEINDPNLFGLWDRSFKDDGSPAHFFWDVATEDRKTLPGPTTLVQTDPAFDHSRTATYGNLATVSEIDHITVRMRIRGLPYSALDELVASGDLSGTIAAQLRTLEIKGTSRHWDRATSGTGAATGTPCSPFSTY